MNISKIVGIVNIGIVKKLKKHQSIGKSCIVKLLKNKKYRKKWYRNKIGKAASIVRQFRSKYRKKNHRYKLTNF